MARKKFTPKVTSVAPDQYSPFVRRHFDNRRRFSNEKLSHIANTGHRKARFRASFRARVGRMPGLTDRFFRLFSMFLVCLVLFATVTNASYSTYQSAVNAIYSFTESVSDVSGAVMETVFSVGEWAGNIGDMNDHKDGDQCILSVKIKGDYYNFVCEFDPKALNRSRYVIVSALDGYSDWVGKEFMLWCGFLRCPDWGIRVFKVQNIGGE